jgi:hypothetical protein
MSECKGRRWCRGQKEIRRYDVRKKEEGGDKPFQPKKKWR